MPALTTEQQTDLTIYKDTIQYLSAVLTTSSSFLTPANIATINDTLAQTLENINDILEAAEDTPSV